MAAWLELDSAPRPRPVAHDRRRRGRGRGRRPSPRSSPRRPARAAGGGRRRTSAPVPAPGCGSAERNAADPTRRPAGAVGRPRARPRPTPVGAPRRRPVVAVGRAVVRPPAGRGGRRRRQGRVERPGPTAPAAGPALFSTACTAGTGRWRSTCRPARDGSAAGLLVRAADVVIEASRPRALAQLGSLRTTSAPTARRCGSRSPATVASGRSPTGWRSATTPPRPAASWRLDRRRARVRRRRHGRPADRAGGRGRRPQALARGRPAGWSTSALAGVARRGGGRAAGDTDAADGWRTAVPNPPAPPPVAASARAAPALGADTGAVLASAAGRRVPAVLLWTTVSGGP